MLYLKTGRRRSSRTTQRRSAAPLVGSSSGLLVGATFSGGSSSSSLSAARGPSGKALENPTNCQRFQAWAQTTTRGKVDACRKATEITNRERKSLTEKIEDTNLCLLLHQERFCYALLLLTTPPVRQMVKTQWVRMTLKAGGEFAHSRKTMRWWMMKNYLDNHATIKKNGSQNCSEF